MAHVILGACLLLLHIYGSTVDLSCSVFFILLMCAVILGLYVEYGRHAVGYHVLCSRHICSGMCVTQNNMKSVYTSAHGHIVDCSEFIQMQIQKHVL